MENLTPQCPMLIPEMHQEYMEILDNLNIRQVRLMIWVLDRDNDQEACLNHSMTVRDCRLMLEELELQEMELIWLDENNYWQLTERGLLATSLWMSILHQEIQDALLSHAPRSNAT